ncbi:hypothetical protein CPB86DRAFT_827706 [Serendipita vermifera]|nr:hypothetical protein CPB86DRAFT_827706 [Serendipita vermifera]
MTSMESIPNEILSFIFEKYIELRLSVWNLITVSQRWNLVAFSTPQLWDTLVVLPSSDFMASKRIFYDKSGVKNYYSGNKHLCHEESQLRRCLSRCGEVTLDVEFRCTKASVEDNNKLATCLKILIGTPISGRLRALSLIIRSNDVMSSEPECFHFPQFHRLEKLSIGGKASSKWYQDLVRVVCNTSILHTLTLHPLPELPDNVWRRLRVINFNLSPEVLDRLASKISHVKELNRGVLPADWPSTRTPAMAFPNLRSIKVRANPVKFRRVQFPNLLELDVADPNLSASYQKDALNFTSFPMLSELLVAVILPERWILNVHLPRLKTLRLSIKLTNRPLTPDIIGATSLHTFTTLNHLSLSGFGQYSTTVYILDAVPSRTTFVDCSSISDSSYLFRMVSHLRKFDDENGKFQCLPKLKELRLSGPFVDNANVTVDLLLQDLALSRKINNAALQKLQVTWPNGSKLDFAIV